MSTTTAPDAALSGDEEVQAFIDKLSHDTWIDLEMEPPSSLIESDGWNVARASMVTAHTIDSCQSRAEQSTSGANEVHEGAAIPAQDTKVKSGITGSAETAESSSCQPDKSNAISSSKVFPAPSDVAGKAGNGTQTSLKSKTRAIANGLSAIKKGNKVSPS